MVSSLSGFVRASDYGQRMTDWQEFYCSIHEHFNSFAMDGTDRKGLFEAEFGKFGRAGFGAVRVDFIDRDENGFATATKADGGFTVERDDAFLDVDNEDDDVGGFDGEFDLFQCRTGDDVISFFASKQ